MIILAVVGLILAVIYCVAEACHERDWPRDMGKYVAIFAVLLIAAVAVFA